jgi:3-methylfumaryl-CoA hydratase
MLALDIDHLREWVGREQDREQAIEPFPARALAGLLEREKAPQEGDPLPLPWHWLYFLDTPRRSEIGGDGHPARGGFLPPVPLPRRMWAAGRIEVAAPLTVGAHVRKVSTVTKVDLKQGKSGPLVFVTVRHQFEQARKVCLVEDQEIVYREAPTGPAALPPGEPAAATAMSSRLFRPDPATLFRFSALTYNGHRIHYDHEYATQVEFYPALVVHAPLLATLLLDLAAHVHPGSFVARFEFRAVRPSFDTGSVRLCASPTAQGAGLWTVDDEGFVGMKASATFA